VGSGSLVVGGGYTKGCTPPAVRLERRLHGGDHDIVVVNPENFMLYQPFLPRWRAG
jgi:NADH dehydrogenase FAD-containing subunit